MAQVRLAHTELEAWIEEQLLTRGELLLALETVEPDASALRQVVRQFARAHARRYRTRLIDVDDDPGRLVLHARLTDWPKDDAERAMQAEQLARARAAYEAGLQPGQPRPPSR